MDLQQFEMRVAIVRAAIAANQIGADYTIWGTGWRAPTYGNDFGPPVRGLFRCDTFVLWAMSAPPYNSTSASTNNWKNFIYDFLNNGPITPPLGF
jgi:hypothetical protein